MAETNNPKSFAISRSIRSKAEFESYQKTILYSKIKTMLDARFSTQLKAKIKTAKLPDEKANSEKTRLNSESDEIARDIANSLIEGLGFSSLPIIDVVDTPESIPK